MLWIFWCFAAAGTLQAEAPFLVALQVLLPTSRSVYLYCGYATWYVSLQRLTGTQLQQTA
jgi:hypothetical protein